MLPDAAVCWTHRDNSRWLAETKVTAARRLRKGARLELFLVHGKRRSLRWKKCWTVCMIAKQRRHEHKVTAMGSHIAPIRVELLGSESAVWAC